MSDQHPTYPNPLIQEAICEVHFDLSEERPWKTELFGEYYRVIQTEFPILEPAAQVGMQFRLDDSGVREALIPARQRMRYRHGTRNLLLQLASDVLVVNVLPKYPGWSQMTADIGTAWQRACDVLMPSKVKRIGLRYINRIDREHAEQKLGDWLTHNSYVPPAVLSSLPGFLSRLEVRSDETHRSVVTLGEIKLPDPPKAFVLDIDCICEMDLSTDRASIADTIEDLHDRVWDIFSSSLTPHLIENLEGGQS